MGWDGMEWDGLVVFCLQALDASHVVCNVRRFVTVSSNLAHKRRHFVVVCMFAQLYFLFAHKHILLYLIHIRLAPSIHCVRDTRQ